MRVYHGSYTEVRHIDLSKSKPQKDFGKGFYVTKFRHHAETWAKIIGEKNNTEGFVTEFDSAVETDFAKNICQIKHFEKYDEEWLDFVVMNRRKRGGASAHDYDVIEGPVADDKVQFTLRAYLREEISKEKFLKMLSRHEETHQICFCTLNSLQLLDYVGNPANINYEISQIVDPVAERLMLENKIDESQATELFYNSQTFTHLADETTKLYEKPWQEIYEMLKEELNRKENQ